MSRRKPADNSATVSLFPFLAVLLCTMGALLVVLVAVSRAAREAALRESALQQQAPTVEPDPEVHRELEKIDQYKASLKPVRSQAEQQLRQDQLRLGHLENHMRRLQDQLAILQAAALELDALEEEHYDDREQAEREIERLQRLVAEARDAVDALKDQIKSAKRSYALIPYEGPNGTYRRPVYIECRKNELILQPEGVRVTRDDLYPPYGAGNPLASALRAARDYYVQLHAGEGQSRDTEPYPLLVVRPDGLVMYDRARRAIESSDFDFGFELVEEDWELKYPVPDPKLAIAEQQAIDLARIRQQALAAAAPRAYRHPALAAAGRFESEDDGDMGYGYSDAGGDAEGFMESGGHGTRGTADEPANESYRQAGGNSAAGGAENGGIDAESVAGEPPGPTIADAPSRRDNPAGSQGSETTAAADGAATASANSSGAGGGANGESANDPNAENQIVVSQGASAQDRPDETQPASRQTARGHDWALDRKNPNAVPVRRTIQVVVRGDQIAILADDAQLDSAAPAGKRIAIQGDTVESLDQVVAAVRDHIEGWGIAGNGLYWRPVLILNIGPDGERRADDLNRLLKNSGIELRVAKFLSNGPQGQRRATPSR